VEQARAVTTQEVPTEAVELYHPLATVTPVPLYVSITCIALDGLLDITNSL